VKGVAATSRSRGNSKGRPPSSSGLPLTSLAGLLLVSGNLNAPAPHRWTRPHDFLEPAENRPEFSQELHRPQSPKNSVGLASSLHAPLGFCPVSVCPSSVVRRPSSGKVARTIARSFIMFGSRSAGQLVRASSRWSKTRRSTHARSCFRCGALLRSCRTPMEASRFSTETLAPCPLTFAAYRTLTTAFIVGWSVQM
jgi:hypothetical protein